MRSFVRLEKDDMYTASINFLPIWKQNFCWFFSKVLTTKYFIFHRFKIDPQKGFFYTPHPWGKSTKVFFQKWQKTAYQTSSNRSILMVFDRFNDVWYAVFCQFWNKTFVNFSQGYWQQNISFYIDLKSTSKKLFFIRHTLEENQQKFSSKSVQKTTNQIAFFFCQVRYFSKSVQWTQFSLYCVPPLRCLFG